MHHAIELCDRITYFGPWGVRLTDSSRCPVGRWHAAGAVR